MTAVAALLVKVSKTNISKIVKDMLSVRWDLW